MCHVSGKRLSIYNFVSGLLKATKKVYLIPESGKKAKIHMGSIRQSLQAQPKNIKKLSKHQINQSNKKKTQIKECIVLQGKNSYGGYPTEFAGSTQNPKIIIRTCSMLSNFKMKRSQKFVWKLPDGICRLDPKS
jgi:hypothetical protein